MKIQTVDRPAAPTATEGEGQLAKTLVPLVVDVAIPLASYYAMRHLFGVSMVTALALSSVVPAARSVVEFVRARRIEGLAILMVAVNVAGIIVGLTTHDARLMMVRDSVTSSVVGLGILISVWRGQPVMSAGLRPFLTKGKPDRIAAYDRLVRSSKPFTALERRYSLIWGFALLADCVARLLGAVTLPVHTMVWLSTVIVIAAIAGAVLVSGGAAADPMEKMITDSAREA
jgi:hypothetical protein